MPPAETPRALDVAGAARCLFCIVGRGLDLRPKGRRCAAVGLRNAPAGADPAAHWFGGRERPPYRAAETGNEPGTPRGAHPCREAYMPPLQTRQPRTRAQKRCHRANVHGPHTCGPYEPAGNNRQMGKAGVCRGHSRPRMRAGFQSGSPDEPYRQERDGIVTESLCLVRNVNRLGRPHQSPGVSKGARRPLWPCPAPRN